MPLFDWTEHCAVGVPEFDRHHQHLFMVVNHLHEAMIAARGRVLVSGILEELISYAKTHFAAEEAFMRSRAFAGLTEHEAEHCWFARRVLDFQARYNAGTTNLTVELMDFLEHWLTQHVQDCDQQYAPPRPLPPLRVL